MFAIISQIIVVVFLVKMAVEKIFEAGKKAGKKELLDEKNNHNYTIS